MKFIEIPINNLSKSMKKLVYGIGINDANYITSPTINGKQLICPYYKVWKNMINRSYSKKYKLIKPSYTKCYICKEWHLFSNFKKWMEKQDWKGKALDKDIIIPNNKKYSPNTCCFVTIEINSLLTNSKLSRGKYPQGVSKKRNTFQANCNIGKKNKKHLGYFNTAKEASLVYKKFKSQIIIDIANKQIDIRIKNGLLLHAKIILEGE